MSYDIVVSKRFGSSMAYHVCVKGRPELWEQGYNEAEAIERLLTTHKEVSAVKRVFQRGLVSQCLRHDLNDDGSIKHTTNYLTKG